MATHNIESDYLRAAKEGVLIPVLMYHQIYHENEYKYFGSAGKKRYAITSDTFMQQMEFLHKQGFETIPIEACIAAARGYTKGVLPPKAVAITFDDGYASDEEIATPILKYFGFTATFFITVGKICTDEYLTPTQINNLLENGMKIGSHTVNHKFLSQLGDEELYFELFESKRILEAITSKKIRYLSLPGGRCNDMVLDASARAGYEIICSSNANGYETPGDVLAQSIAEMVPLRLSRLAISNRTNLEEFKKLVYLDEWELARRQQKQAVLNSVKRALGDNTYNTLWEKYWKVRSFLPRA